MIRHKQLIALGLRRSAIRKRLETGRLHVLYRGVYGVGPPPFLGSSLLIAAVYACGPGALLSHVSAAELWGLLQSSSANVHVTAPGRSRHRQDGIALHLPRHVHDEDRAECEGIPVTSVARTLLDLAATLSYRRVLRAVENAERLRLFDLRAVERLLARNPRARGTRALRRAIAESVHDVPWTRSELERRFRELCHRAGIPQPAVNVWIKGYEVDMVWFEQKVVVELDGWATHSGRGAFERDRKRDVKLQLARYRPVRVTAWRVEHEAEELVAELRELLGLRATTARAGSRGC